MKAPAARGDPSGWRIGLIGYGEVGRVLAEDLRARGNPVAAHDLKLNQPGAEALRKHAERHGVTLHDSPSALVDGCDLVVSAVTASQAVAVALAVAPAIRPGTFVLDLNSSSPGAKRRAAEVVEAAGGRYVEGAVMTSVPPHRIRVPLLLGGPHAVALQPGLASLGFAPEISSARLGVAAATKLCRSVMIKGLEAMVVESLSAARHHGVEDAVIASLYETFPGVDWERQAAYFFQRVIQHGRRRGEEMREAAVTVEEAGLRPWSAAGTAERQTAMADLAEGGVFGVPGSEDHASSADWRVEADRLLAATARPPRT